MALRRDIGQRHAGFERDVEVDGQAQAFDATGLMCGMQDRRRDAVAIRHGISNGQATAGAVSRQAESRLRAVTRADHQREAGRPEAIVEAGLVLKLDLDRHRLARADIGQRGGKEVRALFFHKTCALAAGGGLLIDHAGFLAFLDVAFDEAITNDDLQRIHRRAFR